MYLGKHKGGQGSSYDDFDVILSSQKIEANNKAVYVSLAKQALLKYK